MGKTLFTKTFFKFTFRFAVIVALAIVVAVSAGLYDDLNKESLIAEPLEMGYE